MGGRGSNWVAPVTILVVILAIDVWVYREAQVRRAGGQSVVASVGPVTISTPEQWFLGCLLLWIFVFPLYLVARRSKRRAAVLPGPAA
jgi:hypothetical protein